MGGGCKFDFRFFSILYGTPAPNAERQHPEAWPASTYGHLRGVPANNYLLVVVVPANNLFLSFYMEALVELLIFNFNFMRAS